MLVLLTLPLLAFRCDGVSEELVHRQLRFTNASPHRVIVVVRYDPLLGGEPPQADLTADDYAAIRQDTCAGALHVASGETRPVVWTDDGLEVLLRYYDVTYQVLDALQVMTTPPGELAGGAAVLGRGRYTRTDLGRRGDTIVFE